MKTGRSLICYCHGTSRYYFGNNNLIFQLLKIQLNGEIQRKKLKFLLTHSLLPRLCFTPFTTPLPLPTPSNAGELGIVRMQSVPESFSLLFLPTRLFPCSSMGLLHRLKIFRINPIHWVLSMGHSSFRIYLLAPPLGPPWSAVWISAPVWILSMGCRRTTCSTIIFSTGCRGISAAAHEQFLSFLPLQPWCLYSCFF